MLKNFLMRKLMERQLKNVPKDQADKIMLMVEKNPKLFEQIAKEVEEKKKSGVDQFTAMMSVMQKHQAELKKMMEQ